MRAGPARAMRIPDAAVTTDVPEPPLGDQKQTSTSPPAVDRACARQHDGEGKGKPDAHVMCAPDKGQGAIGVTSSTFSRSSVARPLASSRYSARANRVRSSPTAYSTPPAADTVSTVIDTSRRETRRYDQS